MTPPARSNEVSGSAADGPRTPALSVIERARRGGRTSDKVFEQLMEAIRGLRLLPGQPLSETELARELGVSRTPVREAIARLADAGLVDVVPQVGTTVSVIRLAEVEEARFIRESLEVAALKDAVPLSAADAAGLREVIERQRKALDAGDLEGFFGLDEALHERIFTLSGHRGAWTTVQRTKVHLDRMRRLVLPDRALIAEVIAEHDGIVDALESGDVATAERRVRAHAGRVPHLKGELQRDFPGYFA
ncbi:GntR family transcriptional regulator [Jiangella rhizosphaerae]|uniref:GntR family transcriptional regulator n=1 Tax=Jiangella rhizosphaerae TaxID=2293569 RepID=A0A418KM21_9ACTN|nr:GntR family transcriptional regulator [Jiangella rhizosphaerae]RIQ18981.1 GntR family transcriptional regulator [Jiangella rhizosphaerae]